MVNTQPTGVRTYVAPSCNVSGYEATTCNEAEYTAMLIPVAMGLTLMLAAVMNNTRRR